ncbi:MULTISPECIES: hypothetical protein [Pseudobacillus]|uniref:hypothetical protein n=1 Tax=Pseudobacillus TaxID=108525 RepID=UPI00387A6A58
MQHALISHAQWTNHFTPHYIQTNITFHTEQMGIDISGNEATLFIFDNRWGGNKVLNIAEKDQLIIQKAFSAIKGAKNIQPYKRVAVLTNLTLSMELNELEKVAENMLLLISNTLSDELQVEALISVTNEMEIESKVFNIEQTFKRAAFIEKNGVMMKFINSKSAAIS